MRTGRALRRGAVIGVLALVLAGCGSDAGVTEAGENGAADASTDVADATDDHSDDDHSDDDGDSGDDGDSHGDADTDEDHGDDDNDDGHDDDDHDDEGGSASGLGAHEHGVAELSVAWSDGEVFVDLISPTFNIFGFENEPSTDDERAVVADRTDVLSQPGVMALNDEAGCDLAGAVDTEVEFEGSHAELTASWLFECEDPDEIRQLDVAALFAAFPNLQDIDAQWASPSGQSAAELSPAATVLSLG